MLVVFFLRNKRTTIVNPTVTSAAATIIVKNTTTCPDKSPRNDEKATNERFAAFKISSIDKRIIKMFRRVRRPKSPIEKRAAETMR